MSQQDQVPPVDTAAGPGGPDPVLDDVADTKAAGPVTAAVTTLGVRGEEREDFSKAESKRLRRRSLALLGSLAAPLKARLVLLGVVVVVSTAGTVAGPALIAWGIDNALPRVMDENDWVPAFGVVATYIVVAVLGAVLTAWYTVLAARISQAILFDLRKRVFLHTQRLSLEFHETYTSGRIISRQTSDLDSIRELLDSGLNQLIQGVLYMVFTGIALVLLDPTSGLVLAVSLVPLWFLIRWFQTNSQTLFRATRVTSARVIVHFVETMTGIRAVQAFRKESRNRDEYGGYVEDYRVANTKVFNLFGTFDPVLVLIGNATLAAVVIVGGFRIVGGSLEVGALLAVALYAKRFFDPAQELAMFYNGYQSASAAMEKISGVLEERPSVPDPAKPVRLPDATGAMDFDDVEFAYNAGRSCSPSSTCTSRRGRPSRSSGRPVPGSRRSRSSWRGSTTRRRVPCGSTAWTCGTSTRRTCAARSSWSRRRRTCSPAPSRTTSRSASPGRRGTRSCARRRRSGRTRSSRPCPTGTTPT